MPWTSNELDAASAADELEIATLRVDGTLRKPVTIWVVCAAGALYVRAVKGPTSMWFRHAQECGQGHIDAGDVSKNVKFLNVKGDIDAAIDSAYKTKYERYGASIVDSTLNSTGAGRNA
jgi:hypothetical protein